MADEYCELCDLPRSQCIHGMPAPVPEVTATRPAAKRATPRAKVAKKATPSAVRARPRRWTTPEALAPHIVAVLQDAGGELDADDVFTGLEARLVDSLLEADHERTPEGELRWRYAARRARQALIADGLMARARPGVWELTEAGRATS